MIGTALRLAGQRVLPFVAPGGASALAKEALRTGAFNFAIEQTLPRVLGGEAPSLPETLLRSASIGALSGPIDRGVMAGVKRFAPGASKLQPALTQGLVSRGVPQRLAGGLSSTAAAAGKFGLGFAGAAALTEPITQAVTTAVLPEGYGGGRNIQVGIQGDINVAPSAETTGVDPASIEHQRRLELIYARNYKFPSYIHHISQQQTTDPFAMATQMVSAPNTRYF